MFAGMMLNLLQPTRDLATRVSEIDGSRENGEDGSHDINIYVPK